MFVRLSREKGVYPEDMHNFVPSCYLVLKMRFLLLLFSVFLLLFSQNDSGNLCFRFCCCCVCMFVSLSSQSNSPGSDGVPLCSFLPVLSGSLSLLLPVFSSPTRCFYSRTTRFEQQVLKLSSTDARPSQPVLLFQFLCLCPRVGEGRRFHRSFL